MAAIQTLVCLGRYGDILNALPLARHLSKSGRVRMVVAKEFCSILDGVSYVDPLLWRGDYSALVQCLAWLKGLGVFKPVVVQSYGHPSADRSICYQKDGWRIAGHSNLWGTLPLVLDRRNPDRETKIIEGIPAGKPWVLVHQGGVSSPIPELGNLVTSLRDALPDYEIIDLTKMNASRIFDMVGLLNVCELLVSVDSVYLHLCKAARCPVVAIVNDKEQWRASETPPASILKLGYREATTPIVVDAVVSHLNRPKARVFHAACVFGQEQRHFEAYLSWKKLAARGMIGVYRSEYARSFDDNGRKLPYLSDVLAPALEQMEDYDVLLWANDDIILKPEILDHARDIAGTFGAFSMRRDNEHQGRDLFAFRKSWLAENPIPDVILGAPRFDLLLLSIIRHSKGIVSTIGNIGEDFYPCDSERRYTVHSPHEESWREGSPGADYNAGLFSRWLEEKSIRFW